MKYTAKIKSRQFILDEKKKKVFIEPGEGEMSDKDAYAVAKSKWGKRLIQTGCLTFEKPIEVKEDKIQRGMSIPKNKWKRNREKDSPDNAGEGEASGDDSEGNGDDDGVNVNVNLNTETSDEIPDFNKNAGEGGEG